MAVQNGKLPLSSLTYLGFNDRYGRAAMLVQGAADSLRRLSSALGVDLGTDDLSDTYRPYDRQEGFFRDRFTTIPIDGYQYAVRWEGKTWYLRPGEASAAVPGQSNHGWGTTIDAYGRLKAAMRNNPKTTAEHGWKFTIPSEDWHAEWARSRDQHYGEEVEEDMDKDTFIQWWIEAAKTDIPGAKGGDNKDETLSLADHIRKSDIFDREARRDRDALMAAYTDPEVIVKFSNADLKTLSDAFADELARRLQG